jgi:hypothetical protein
MYQLKTTVPPPMPIVIPAPNTAAAITKTIFVELLLLDFRSDSVGDWIISPHVAVC